MTRFRQPKLSSRPANRAVPDGHLVATHPGGGLDGMNKVAGLSWWVIGILIVIVAASLILVNR